jgi:hypothetical protein
LRGADGQARLESDEVVLRRKGEEVVIPVAAIEEATARGRVLAIVVRTPEGHAPAGHQVTDVGELAAQAFADAVNSLARAVSPADRPVDGTAVTVTRPVPEREDRARTFLLLATVLLLVASIPVTIGLAGDWTKAGHALLATLMGSWFAAFFGYAVRETYLLWWMPRHGITVRAEFSHYTNKTPVYRYTDTDGNSHEYRRESTAKPYVEVCFHPRKPEKAVASMSVAGRVGMSVLAPIAGGGLAFFLYLLIQIFIDVFTS